MASRALESMRSCRKCFPSAHPLESNAERPRKGPIDTAIFRDGEAKGLFDSDIISAGTLMGRMGKAEEVAKVFGVPVER